MGVEPKFWNNATASFAEAIQAFETLSTLKTPTEKIACMVTTSRKIESYLNGVMGPAM
jgi:hypothetical protein